MYSLKTRSLFDKYHVSFERKQRFYRQDLTERSFDLECTTPHRLTVDGKQFEQHAWGELIKALFNYLFDAHPSKIRTATNFEAGWSKQPIITREKRTNAKQLASGLWVNCNHTALHSCWLIQDILDYFDIPLDSVEMIIKRPPAAEPIDLRISLKADVKKSFSLYLRNLGKEEDVAETIINNIERFLNPILASISKAYNDLFLFDSVQNYYNYEVKVAQWVNERTTFNDKNKQVLVRYLRYLREFYKCSDDVLD